MKLKKSDGTSVKKTTVDIVDRLYKEEVNKKNSDDRKRVFEQASENIRKEAADLQVSKLPISSMYSAPYNEEWNDFKKLNADKAYELNQSIVDGGLLTPIIVWKIDKNMVKELYENNEDPYGFIGNEYMILAGHSRTYAFVQLYNATQDIKYTKIDAIVRENLTYDEARYIIKVTNFVNRELSAKEKRRNIKFMHDTLSKNKTKGMAIAKKIANDTGSALRTVQYQIEINEKLIPEFIQMYDDEILTQGNVLKIAKLNQSLQQWMYETYGDRITNDVMKNFQKYFDRKELIETLFIDKDIVYIDITTKIPSHLEKKFRNMVKNWVKRNR